ncbi:MAG TPA: PSD1 and planctomycete cytochrome C domain-containing protein [Urbifossiella sp.]|nr:PSD1 and planctomycete cytochrome C domain-containing protein [Urbifossiella sp.]
MNRHLLLLTVVVSLVPAAARAQDARHFETRVRPLLAEKCFKCHGPDRQRSDLRLDTADGFKKGGASGTPLVTPGRVDDSLLLRAVRHADGVEKMPPDGQLTAAQVADLAAWVRAGAPFPAAVAKAPAADPAKHWAFRPVVRPDVPKGANPIDAFVRARLAAAGLSPAPPADRRALIRRATFDLIGLPPTPAEVEAFLKDAAPDAFATVVDRLLASPDYGERWGRHWLDVARYADSNGLDENVAHGTAWRYRDYVVRSLNADKPYDQFLREQLAGDLLPAATPAVRAEQLVATGFLALGPKVLAEPDEKRMELDIVDEQIDTVGRTVLGLTLGCARCHDHKFDPIEQADYYGLAGVFVSTRTMEHFKKVARWHENPIATPAELRAKADADAGVAALKNLAKTTPALNTFAAALAAAAPELPTAMGVADGTPTDVRVLRRGNHLTPADVVPRRFPLVLAGAAQPTLPKGQSGRLELAAWLTDPRHPLTARVIVNRVWRWHFGKGLVRSVDNFGLTGDAPTHPELLDWLAAEFTADGWSLKRLHRRIMLSATYQMSTAHDAKAATADPDNRLLWRANPRRLEAEAIRDSLLAVGGLLDRTAGGPALVGVKNRDYLFDHTSKDRTSYVSDRRSLYLPVIRNNLYDVFQLFDAPDPAVPTGDRATTTVPTQALFFLNSDLSARSADGLAGRVLAAPGLDDAGRVRLLFELAYGRPPTVAEVARVIAGVAAFEADTGRRAAWAAVCQAVLAGNEFIHLN